MKTKVNGERSRKDTLQVRPVEMKKNKKESREQEVCRAAFSAVTFEEGLEILRTGAPQFYTKNKRKIERNLKSMFLDRERKREREKFCRENKGIPSTDRDPVKICDKGMWTLNKKDYGVLSLDSTDHMNIQHSECGKSMEIKSRKPEYFGSSPALRKKLWFDIRCVNCETGWKRWRKVILSEEKGEFKPTKREQDSLNTRR